MKHLKIIVLSCLCLIIGLAAGYGVAADRYKTEPVTPVSYEKQLETAGGTDAASGQSTGCTHRSTAADSSPHTTANGKQIRRFRSSFVSL